MTLGIIILSILFDRDLSIYLSWIKFNKQSECVEQASQQMFVYVMIKQFDDQKCKAPISLQLMNSDERTVNEVRYIYVLKTDSVFVRIMDLFDTSFL